MEYDDVLPVSLFTSGAARLMLDRHHDLIATFDDTMEREDCERIVAAINAHTDLTNQLH